MTNFIRDVMAFGCGIVIGIVLASVLMLLGNYIADKIRGR